MSNKEQTWKTVKRNSREAKRILKRLLGAEGPYHKDDIEGSVHTKFTVEQLRKMLLGRKDARLYREEPSGDYIAVDRLGFMRLILTEETQ
jgi:hypothetical protein